MTDLENSPGPDSASEPLLPTPDFAAAEQPPYIRTLFFGPDGLRPGWGFAFYVVMFYFLYRLANELAERFGPTGTLRSMMLEEFCALLAAVVPSLILARVERRPWEAYGLPPRQAFRKLFWVGAAWGLAGISLLLITLNRVHVFDFGHLALHGPRIVKYAAFWAAMFLLVGCFEEFLLRGYTQFTLTRAVGFWWAAIMLSCAFGLIHIKNGGEEWNGLLAVAFIGLFFALTLRRTGSLWFAVGFHAAWDWGETFVYSVPDSGIVFPGHLLKSSLHGARWLTGGSVGPEGSALCFVVIAVLWMAFDRVYRDVSYQPE
jgi:CAAX protease family protein